MNTQQYEQVVSQLPAGERIARVYLAFEGDLRVVSTDADGNETRYTVIFDSVGNARIRKM